jgi:hypothetical protein
VGVASGGYTDAVITEKRLQFCECFAESFSSVNNSLLL